MSDERMGNRTTRLTTFCGLRLKCKERCAYWGVEKAKLWTGQRKFDSRQAADIWETATGIKGSKGAQVSFSGCNQNHMHEVLDILEALKNRGGVPRRCWIMRMMTLKGAGKAWSQTGSTLDRILMYVSADLYQTNNPLGRGDPEGTN